MGTVIFFIICELASAICGSILLIQQGGTLQIFISILLLLSAMFNIAVGLIAILDIAERKNDKEAEKKLMERLNNKED